MEEFFKNYKSVLIGILILIIVGVLGFFVYRYFSNEYALTIDEKTWIDENASSVININVVNDSNIFGINASGVFYDFLEDFSSNYNLSVNPITYKFDDQVEGITLGITNEVSDSDVVFYTDYYVVLSKNYEIINSYSELNDKTIGVLSTNKSKVSAVLSSDFKTYDSSDELFDDFDDGEIEYVVVPRYLYADLIIENDYDVVYHLSDVNYYYTLSTDDSVASSVLVKYFYSVWKSEVYDSFKDSEFSLYKTSLSLTDSEVDKLTSVDYTYGFVENSPYEVISSGQFGGVSAVFLKEFSDFSGAEFEFIKYSSYEDLLSAVESNNVNVFLNKYNVNTDYKESTYGYNPSYTVIAKRDNSIVVNSIEGLSGQTVYVEENTKLYSYLSSFTNIDLQTYSGEDELFKLNKKDVIIIIDSNSFEFYLIDDLDNYTSRYTFNTDFSSNYAVSTDDVLYTLMDEYMNLSDDSLIIVEGIDNHYDTVSIGMLIASIAKYLLLIICASIVVIILFIKKSKKIQIARKIKKDDKLKYIDQLTSLKNRNYFNDSKESWNNNTIYPQTIVIIDLNKIQKLNDQFGYNEGDRQIKAFANALIKTQLDNSEIMRTDGNEFVIYLVGYSQKQVVNYIHKLNKEVDKLPYKEGAKFGYSMILDNIKTCEDALNDAAKDMLEKNKDE